MTATLLMQYNVCLEAVAAADLVLDILHDQISRDMQ